MPRSRSDLETELAELEHRLANLPPAHLQRHQGLAIARRIALQAHVDGLREQLSTAPVHERPQPVGDGGEVANNDNHA